MAKTTKSRNYSTHFVFLFRRSKFIQAGQARGYFSSGTGTAHREMEFISTMPASCAAIAAALKKILRWEKKKFRCSSYETESLERLQQMFQIESIRAADLKS